MTPTDADWLPCHNAGSHDGHWWEGHKCPGVPTPKRRGNKMSKDVTVSKDVTASTNVRLIPNEKPGMDHDKGWTKFGDDFRVRWVKENNQLVIATPTGNLVMHPVTENFVYLEVEQ